MHKLTRIGLASAVLSLAFGQAAHADSVTLPITGGGKGTPIVDITIKDKDGKEVTVKGVLDTGAEINLGMNQATADKLGLAAGAAQKIVGAAGETDTKVTDTPAAKGGSFKDAKASDATKFNLPVKGSTIIVPGLDNDQVLIGTGLINSDPAGPGSLSINWEKKTVKIHNNAQAKALAALPLQTPMQLAVADLHPEGSPPASWAVSVDVFGGGLSVDASFLVATGFDQSFISASLAAELGLSPQGSTTIHTGLGTLSASLADVGLEVFDAEGQVPFSVAVLSSADNPDGINVLGADFLQRYAEVQWNPSTMTFSATAVPEPSFGWLWMGGLVAMHAGMSAARRRGG